MELDHPDANITPEVVVGITNLLIVAGIDTTWSSIGSALWHLATNPSDRERLFAPGPVCNKDQAFPGGSSRLNPG